MVNPMYMKNIPDRFRLGLLGRRVSCWGIAVLSSACLAAQEVVVPISNVGCKVGKYAGKS